MNVSSRNCPFINDFGGYSSGYGGGRVENECLAVQRLEDINRSLGTVCSLIEDISVSLLVKFQGNGVLRESVAIDGCGGETPMEAVEQEPGIFDGKALVAGQVDHHGD